MVQAVRPVPPRPLRGSREIRVVPRSLMGPHAPGNRPAPPVLRSNSVPVGPRSRLVPMVLSTRMDQDRVVPGSRVIPDRIARLRRPGRAGPGALISRRVRARRVDRRGR